MTLYLLTNLKTGLRYVGATTLSLPRRMGGHRRDALVERRSTMLCEAIREHGWEAFDLAILATTDDFDQLMRMERETIAALGTLTPNGYNMASGGVGVPDLHPKENTRAKIRAARVGATPWNKGKKTGPQARAVIANRAAKLKGRPTWNAGKQIGPAVWNQKPINYQGHVYASIKEAATTLGVSRDVIRWQLEKGGAAYVAH